MQKGGQQGDCLPETVNRGNGGAGAINHIETVNGGNGESAKRTLTVYLKAVVERFYPRVSLSLFPRVSNLRFPLSPFLRFEMTS